MADLKNRGSLSFQNPALMLTGGTVLVVCGAIFLVIFVLRKSRLNWYERNLLEIAQSEPQYIRYQKPKMQDTFDSADDTDQQTVVSEDETSDESMKPKSYLHKQQSRLYKEANGLGHGHHLAPPVSAITGDFSEKFVVPKSPSCSTVSMYQKLTTSQFDRDLYDSRQDSTASEDQVLGECGSLKMALTFDENLSLLTVQLRQAANLMAQQAEELPNPYFKVTLHKPEPNTHPHMQQSRVYRQTRSPEVTDEFYFDVPLGHLHNCKLEVMVFDFDQCSVDECIGYCWLSLNRIEISTEIERPSVFWAEVMPVQRAEDNYGEILFSIAHLCKAQRLTISIFKARKLIQPEEFTELPAPQQEQPQHFNPLECPTKCYEGETCGNCMFTCEKKCESMESLLEPCKPQFISDVADCTWPPRSPFVGCHCNEGLVRYKGACIEESVCKKFLQCGECAENEYCDFCGNFCDRNCSHTDFKSPNCGEFCGIPSCACKEGFFRFNGKCVAQAQCPDYCGLEICGDDEVCSHAKARCERHCPTGKSSIDCKKTQGEEPGCICKLGHVRKGGQCVRACETCYCFGDIKEDPRRLSDFKVVSNWREQ